MKYIENVEDAPDYAEVFFFCQIQIHNHKMFYFLQDINFEKNTTGRKYPNKLSAQGCFSFLNGIEEEEFVRFWRANICMFNCPVHFTNYKSKNNHYRNVYCFFVCVFCFNFIVNLLLLDA